MTLAGCAVGGSKGFPNGSIAPTIDRLTLRRRIISVSRPQMVDRISGDHRSARVLSVLTQSEPIRLYSLVFDAFFFARNRRPPTDQVRGACFARKRYGVRLHQIAAKWRLLNRRCDAFQCISRTYQESLKAIHIYLCQG